MSKDVNEHISELRDVTRHMGSHSVTCTRHGWTRLAFTPAKQAGTRFTYAGGWKAELAWVVWLNTKTVYPRTVTHLSTNRARRRVTSLMQPTMIPLSQPATTELVY